MVQIMRKRRKRKTRPLMMTRNLRKSQPRRVPQTASNKMVQNHKQVVVVRLFFTVNMKWWMVDSELLSKYIM